MMLEKRWIRIEGAVLLAAALALLACGGSGESPAPSGSGGGKPLVMTTFYPTTYFAERIGGDAIDVVCPVPPDVDAIFWEPPEKTILQYQSADMIIVNGAEFEKWVLVTSLPESKVVDTAKPFEGDLLVFAKAVTHSHGPAGKHSHEGIDGHTWVDPVNAKVQAGEILKALKRLVPDRADDFQKNYDALAKDLDGLDADLRAMGEKAAGKLLLASHPAYNYLKKRYGFDIVNLSLDPEEMPSDEAFAGIKKALETRPAKWILWEADPLPEIADRFQSELGIRSVTFSPCELMDTADLEAGKDYLTVMRANLDAFGPVFAD